MIGRLAAKRLSSRQPYRCSKLHSGEDRPDSSKLRESRSSPGVPMTPQRSAGRSRTTSCVLGVSSSGATPSGSPRSYNLETIDGLWAPAETSINQKERSRRIQVDSEVVPACQAGSSTPCTRAVSSLSRRTVRARTARIATAATIRTIPIPTMGSEMASA